MSFQDLSQQRPASSTFGFFSIRTHLLLLIAAVLVPMLAQVAVLAWYYGAARQEALEIRRLDLAEDLRDAIEREVQMRYGYLSGIGMSPTLQAGQPDAIQRITEHAIERGFEGIALFEADGQIKFTSPTALQPLFTHPDELGFSELKAGKKVFVSNLLAMDGGKPAFYLVTVPITTDDKIAFYMSGVLAAKNLRTIFAETRLPDGWTAGEVDRKGTLVARSQRPEAYVGMRAQDPMVRAMESDRSSGVFDVVSREGIAIKNTFIKSPLTGWGSGVAAPAALVNAPLWESMLGMLVLALGLTLIALFLAILVANRIARAVHQLGHAAVAFAAGDVVPVNVSTTAHVEDVSQALEAAASTANLREARRRR